MMTQLLANPEFDDAPMGAGWTEQRIQSNYPLITSADNAAGPMEHSGPYKAWLAGLTGSGVTDALYQDFTIPPGTTRLVLAGLYEVRSDETTTSMAYDTATLVVAPPGGATIATVLSLSNLSETAAWTPFNYTFTQNLSGQTIRLRISSRSDSSSPTSFYFDTLSLTAIHGCP